MEYAKEYGDIFSIRVGQRWTVVLNGAATIKEALLKKGVEFANRPTSFTSKPAVKHAMFHFCFGCWGGGNEIYDSYDGNISYGFCILPM